MSRIMPRCHTATVHQQTCSCKVRSRQAGACFAQPIRVYALKFFLQNFESQGVPAPSQVASREVVEPSSTSPTKDDRCVSLSTGQTNRTAGVQFWTVRARRISLRCAVHCALKTLTRFEKRLSVDAHRIAEVILCIAPKRSALCVSSPCQSFHDMHMSSMLIRFENTVKAIILTRRI